MLLKLSYLDFEGEPNEWQLEPIDFGIQNLVVGRNSTGKSRLVNVTSGLLAILAGTRGTDTLQTGRYCAELKIDEIEYKYEIDLSQNFVKSERLIVNGVERLTREQSGKGKIYYEAEETDLKFEVEPSAIAVQTKRDRLQHPYILALSEWAASSTLFGFGRPVKNQLAMQTTLTAETPDAPSTFDPHDVLRTYIKGYRRFGDSFDHAIVEDLRAIGFQISEVHATVMEPRFLAPAPSSPVLTLAVHEEGLAAPVNQISMSDGMFRSLALTINLNWLIFTSTRGMLLVDDLGEGLDYERACHAIELTMRRAKEHRIQVVVTSNDRFVMNAVPLDSWILLTRSANKVRGQTSRNSPELFENFEYTGLSNFDFFATNSLVH